MQLLVSNPPSGKLGNYNGFRHHASRNDVRQISVLYSYDVAITQEENMYMGIYS